MELYKKGVGMLIMPTRCKQWGCLGCRDRVRARVERRIAYGCSMVERSWLITLTLRQGPGIQRNARYVQKVWTEFLRRLKPIYPQMAWFKIVEATKNRQPHLHLIMSGIGTNRIACDTGKNALGRCIHEFSREWLDSTCKNNCIEHEMAKVWHSITNDSYVVDAREVAGAKGAAKYLTKYLTKVQQHYQVLLDLGFSRRWACSRNWPREPEERLVVTSFKAWDKVSFHIPQGAYSRDFYRTQAEIGLDSPLATRVDSKAYEDRMLEKAKREIRKVGKKIAPDR